MMRILLANIPWEKNGRPGVRAGSRWPHIKDSTEGKYLPFPFYLAYTAALLKKNGFDVSLVDALALEMSEDSFLNLVSQARPDLLLAETSTPSLENDLELLRKIDGDIAIALCGPDMNIREPAFLQANKFVDYVLVGEYEATLLELAQRLRVRDRIDGLPGLIYRTPDGEVKVNPPRPLIKNLNELPWPMREGLPMEKYVDTPGGIPTPSVQMWASRGCPYRCIFCFWPQVMYGCNSYRVRDVVDVVDEMEHLVERMGFKSIYFDDDTFNIGRMRMLRFCAELRNRKRQGRLNVPWAIMARADTMDEEVLDEMRSAGLFALKYGVESGVQELVDRADKNMDLKKVKRIVKYTKTLGIMTHLTFTFGLPGETKDTIQKTIDLALELDPSSVQFSITTPFPGTGYFKDLDARGYILSKNWEDYDGNSKSVIRTGALSAKDLEEARRRAYEIWGEHIRKRGEFRIVYSPGFLIRKFNRDLREHGLRPTFRKAMRYSVHVLKKNRSLATAKRKAFVPREERRISPLLKLGISSGRWGFAGPRIAQLDLTNDCNNSCLGCWTHSPLLGEEALNTAEKRSALTLDAVKGIVDELARMGTEEIQLSGAGEPFMHPDILEILKIIKGKDIRCSIITNFTLVNESTVKRLIELSVDHITISLWAGCAETYTRLHPNQSEETFYRIRRNLKVLSTSRSDTGLPRIKIYNVICNFNCGELEAMLDFALDVGADSMEFQVIDLIPGKTDSLALSAKDKNLLIGQFRDLKARIDCPHQPGGQACLRQAGVSQEAGSGRQASSLSQDEHALELLEFGRFLEKKPDCSFFSWESIISGKPHIFRALNCPAGKCAGMTHENPRIDENRSTMTFRFPASGCRICNFSNGCTPSEGERQITVHYLSFLGFGSFARRILSPSATSGEYDSSVVDSMPCYAGWLFARILADGKVIPCCKAKDLSMGNINERPFARIWNSYKYCEFRFKAKTLKKSDPYFSKINCYKSCDNVGMNLELHRQLTLG